MQTNNNQQQQYKTRINQFIRVPQVRVILSNGENGGIMATHEALKLARDEGLDLVEINPTSQPPVCKIVDHGKMKYEEKKKQQAAKKNQMVQELKEITFRPNTDIGDLDHKLAQAKGFLEDGNKVKFTIRFRGREISHSNIGRDKLDFIVKELDGLIVPNPTISLEGKFMSMLVQPTKNMSPKKNIVKKLFSDYTGKSETQAKQDIQNSGMKCFIFNTIMEFSREVERLDKIPFDQRSHTIIGLLIKDNIVVDLFCV
jgi:translation initiation factor IF-3